MEPKLMHYDGGAAIGVVARTRLAEQAETAAALWARFAREGVGGRVAGAVQPLTRVAAYYDYDSDATPDHSILAGVLVTPGVAVAAGLTRVVIPSGEYLVFRAEGADALPATWRRIADYFGRSHREPRKYSVDFELYRQETLVDVHIAVT